MSQFFSYYPKTLYSNDTKPTSLDTITNIISRFRFEPTVATNAAAFYYYNIKDSDTPEIIASKYYDNPERHWIVLMFNNIVDPFYDWPMTYQQFVQYINDKYGSQAAALAQNHHYEKIVTTVDSTTGSTAIKNIEIDYNTYLSINPQTTTQTFSDGSSVTYTLSSNQISIGRASPQELDVQMPQPPLSLFQISLECFDKKE